MHLQKPLILSCAGKWSRRDEANMTLSLMDLLAGQWCINSFSKPVKNPREPGQCLRSIGYA
jgi:hypothetical protein